MYGRKDARQVWENKIQFVYDTFEQLKQEIDLDWNTQKNESQTNRTSVYLYFPPRPSGIVKSNQNGSQHYPIESSDLAFTQSSDGRITVWMTYPYIKEFQPKPENKAIALIEPDEITEEKIYDFVETFLQNLTESNRNNTPEIGFKSHELER